ncbi:MAG: hypothetical protein F6K10_02385 [Moorea sp. SIO2B7]|nr:hypothetical protein [Moorena sp. SIO2B7]
MDNRFEPLSSGEVVSVDHSVQFLIGHSTFRVQEFTDALELRMLESGMGLTEEKAGWLREQGNKCEVLKFGSQGWQKGRVRLYLEFCSDSETTQVLNPDQEFEPLSSGEVVSVDHSVQFLIGHSTFRINEFEEALKHRILDAGIGGITEDKIGWLLEEGIPCEVLKFASQGWQKGRVRLHLEFCSDEPTTAQVETDKVIELPPVSQPELETTSASFQEVQDFAEASQEEEELQLDDDFSSEPDLDFGAEASQEEEELQLDDDFSSEPDLDFGAEALQEEEELQSDDDFSSEPDLDFGAEALQEEEELQLDDDFSSEPDLDFGAEALQEEEELQLDDDFSSEPDLDFGAEALQEEEELQSENPFAEASEKEEEQNQIFGAEEDEDLAEISQSIDEELDFGEIEEDNQFDLGEDLASNDEEIDLDALVEEDDDLSFEDFGSSDDPKKEDREKDDLFDDVWQDMQ